jgi:hypothetical protein
MICFDFVNTSELPSNVEKYILMFLWFMGNFFKTRTYVDINILMWEYLLKYGICRGKTTNEYMYYTMSKDDILNTKVMEARWLELGNCVCAFRKHHLQSIHVVKIHLWRNSFVLTFYYFKKNKWPKPLLGVHQGHYARLSLTTPNLCKAFRNETQNVLKYVLIYIISYTGNRTHTSRISIC